MHPDTRDDRQEGAKAQVRDRGRRCVPHQRRLGRRQNHRAFLAQRLHAPGRDRAIQDSTGRRKGDLGARGRRQVHPSQRSQESED